ATSSESPSLQRWAAASLRHLIAEDRRLATCSSYRSSAGTAGLSSSSSRYEPFVTRLVSTGGIMILCSLLSSDEAIVVSAREIGPRASSGRSPPPSSTSASRAGRGTADDSAIVDAIASNGGCGPALAHLLISADESVSYLGCSFASSLISPLLTDPRGSGQGLRRCVVSGLDPSPDDINGEMDDGLSSYRRAALALVVPGGPGEVSCLPSLIQILRSGAGGGVRGGEIPRDR
ncbi:hypothetical protein JZU54_08720, partial [bacterium]|nr:hypothetical protein [bacterium]